MSDESHNENNEPLIEESDGKTLYDFLDKFDAEDYKVFVTEFKEMAIETRKARLVETRTLSLPVFGIITLIFSAITILAGYGRIEGHYVTSVGGVIVGYMLSFLEVSFAPKTTS